ncbi:GntR family transcriptional regulator [Virgibacillus sp. CBA3643]|uniref:GntR family transcriptional regulator n=1 Tax=Virgibacillus sp. CBA3643 TaxID=2942278 RepID=UPI0035A2D020
MEKTFTKEDSPKPLYQQVADWMIENIKTEKWETGYKLLAEEDLAKQLNLSRGTIRKAIALLIDQQLLVQIHGKGTYVENHKISYPFAQELISFAESMESKGYTFETKVLKQKIIQPSPFIQAKLDIDSLDLVLYLKRVRSINNEAAILLENWISLKYCHGIEHEDFEEISLFKAIEKYADSTMGYGIRNFSARSLNNEQAELLSLEVNDPVLFLDQFIFGQEDIPFEYSQVLLRTDKYEITSILTR